MEENQRRERIPKVRFTKKKSDQSTIKKLIFNFLLENFKIKNIRKVSISWQKFSFKRLRIYCINDKYIFMALLLPRFVNPNRTNNLP